MKFAGQASQEMPEDIHTSWMEASKLGWLKGYDKVILYSPSRQRPASPSPWLKAARESPAASPAPDCQLSFAGRATTDHRAPWSSNLEGKRPGSPTAPSTCQRLASIRSPHSGVPCSMPKPRAGLTCCFTLGACARSPHLPVHGPDVRLAGAAGAQ